jgi:hypothetical protein
VRWFDSALRSRATRRPAAFLQFASAGISVDFHVKILGRLEPIDI